MITLNYKSREVRLWKVLDKFYALASSSCVRLPQDIIFVDFYFSKNYPDGVYVKYISSDNCGILYVSETEVSIVISHEECYEEIVFENGLFYADTREGENKYHVISESLKHLGSFSSKCKKLENSILFYNESSIFINSVEFKIPGGIISVEVIIVGSITLVKILNKKGIYYYTKDISFLLGPIRKEKIIPIDFDSCYIQEVINGKIRKVFYIENNDTYICESLSCYKGINVFPTDSQQYNPPFFVTADKAVYFFEKKFTFLIKNINADMFTFTYSSFDSVVTDRCDFCNFVAFLKEKPVYYASYDMKEKKIVSSGTLDVIGSGYVIGTNICKGDNKILVINKLGKILISTTGKNCYKGSYEFNIGLVKSGYIVEKTNNEIEFYSSKSFNKLK